MKVIYALAAGLLLALGACSGSGKDASKETADTTAAAVQEQPVVELSDDAVLRPDQARGKVTAIDFNATWCVPCRKFAPAFDAAAKEFKDVEFISVDIDANPQTAQAFNVESVPTVIILDKDGKELRRCVGIGEILPAENFMAIIRECK